MYVIGSSTYSSSVWMLWRYWQSLFGVRVLLIQNFDYSRICLGGDIFDKVIEIGNFTENQAQAIFVRIMRAINYFSIFNIVHRSLTFEFIFRDLKPENFLFLNRDDLNTIQMIDFGLAKKYKLGLPMLNTKAGTVNHYN